MDAFAPRQQYFLRAFRTEIATFMAPCRQENLLKSLKLFELVVAIGGLVGGAFAAPVHLRCEYRENPLGIGAKLEAICISNSRGEQR
jgi:hypothetical protein